MPALLSVFKVIHGDNLWLATIELNSFEEYGLLLGDEILFVTTLGQDIAFYCTGALMLGHFPHE